MSRYRPKPPEVEAFQLTPCHFEEGLDEKPDLTAPWFLEALKKEPGQPGSVRVSEIKNRPCFRIETDWGTRAAVPGDWIIRDPDGAIHPCKDETFSASYELVEDQ